MTMLLFPVISILYLLVQTPTIYAAVGCMDTSHYLTEEIDHKELHYVSCDCACDHTTLLRTHGTCLLCQHVHIPREWIIMRNGKHIATTLQYRSTTSQDLKAISSDTQSLIQRMIALYKKRNK